MDSCLIAPGPDLHWRATSHLDDRQPGERDLLQIAGTSDFFESGAFAVSLICSRKISVNTNFTNELNPVKRPMDGK